MVSVQRFFRWKPWSLARACSRAVGERAPALVGVQRRWWNLRPGILVDVAAAKRKLVRRGAGGTFGLLISLVTWEGTFRVSAEGTLTKPAEVASAAVDVDIAAPCYRGACARTR